MGYRQLRDKLELETGWQVCDVSVWRSMKRRNIRGYTRKARYLYSSGKEHHIHPNISNRKFNTLDPLRKVVSDITYIKHKGKCYYLICYLYLFNNEVIEWELSDSLGVKFVLDSAQKGFWKNKVCTDYPIFLHSDQGIQCTSSAYQALLREYNVVQSMSRAGNPKDNAVMESFFGRFKDVLSFQFRYWLEDDLRSVVTKTIHYFNYIRPVRKLNEKTPVQFRIEQALNLVFLCLLIIDYFNFKRRFF